MNTRVPRGTGVKKVSISTQHEIDTPQPLKVLTDTSEKAPKVRMSELLEIAEGQHRLEVQNVRKWLQTGFSVRDSWLCTITKRHAGSVRIVETWSPVVTLQSAAPQIVVTARM
jgi:hypothetical protein